MCSIANLLNTNTRKFDSKKTYFFCPKCLDCVNKISVLEVEL